MRTPEQDEWVQWLVGFGVEAKPERGASLGDYVHDERAAPVENRLAGSVNAAPKTTAPQTLPLAQKQTSPQSTTSPQKKSPPQPQAPAKPQPIVYPRTAQIDTSGQDKRKDRLAITGAKTPEALSKVVEGPGHNGLSAKKLGEISRILKEASMMNSGVPDSKVPTEDETNKLRENYANLNAAISNGKFDDAGRIGLDLGLPITDEEIEAAVSDPKNLSDKKWKTLLALGLAKINATKKMEDGTAKFKWDSNPAMDKVPNQELSALNGTAGYAQLMDDMAVQGVKPLSAPPAQDQITKYMENVQAKAATQALIDHPGDPDAQKSASSDTLLAASQRLMTGMQVHYRGASAKDPVYGPTKMQTTFLFRKGALMKGQDGKPLSLELPFDMDEAKKKAAIKKFAKDNGGDDWFSPKTETPEGYGANTSRDVYGNRYESDCEGMASLRLRTLPPGFKSLGAVTGFLRVPGKHQDDGHLVGVFQSTDGRVFLSSNGKAPIEVKASGKVASGSEIRAAVVAEFDAIYIGDQTESDFVFGLGKTSSTLDPNDATDRVLREAAADEYLRADPKYGKKKIPPLDWDSLAP
jgi:hypothetical protein